MQNRTAWATVRVAATYAGTVIGAGFASGQEIAQFFVVFGPPGLLGILVAGILFALLGSRLMELAFRLKATAYHQVIYHLCGRRIGLVLDAVTALFLLASLAIMLAGAATVFRDYFHIPYLAGLAVAALAVAVTVLFGVGGVTAANLVVTPLLVVTILSISLHSFVHHNFDTALLTAAAPGIDPPAPHWLLSALLYVSYNLVVGSTVLVPLGSATPRRRVRLLGGLGGGLALGFLATFLALVVMIHYPDIMRYEVPILQLASSQHVWSSIIYAAALLAAMYTTAIASLYGCVTKIEATTGVKPVAAVTAITLVALLCSQIGFASLIKLLFPLFGYATLYFTVRLAWSWFRYN